MWTKLDDGFTEHPKVARVGALGMALQVAGLVYCNRNLTDGFIPYDMARRLLPMKHVDEDGIIYSVAVSSNIPVWDGAELVEKLIGWLLDAEMWEEVVGGYIVHDFDDFNPSREQVIALREARSEAGKKGGLAKAKATAKQEPEQMASNASSNAASKEEAKSYPAPAPAPAPETDPVETSLVAPTERRSRSNGNKAPRISETEAFNLDALRNRNPVWERLGESGVTKLNGVYGLAVVSEALTRARSTDLDPENAYPYLEAICKELVGVDA
jgi:hypothetical protein